MENHNNYDFHNIILQYDNSDEAKFRPATVLYILTQHSQMKSEME